MNLKNKKYWLFDMDGTLTCAMHDFDAMREALALPKGVPILEALAALTPELAQEKHQELDEMELKMAADAIPQPGSEELLTHLLSFGAKIGIVTRNGKHIAKATLRACGLNQFFSDETIISRDCCTAKPDPAGINLLLTRWVASHSEAVMVGDFLFDLQAGFDAGVTTVHMDVSQQFSWPEITTVCVGSLHDLRRLVA